MEQFKMPENKVESLQQKTITTETDWLKNLTGNALKVGKILVLSSVLAVGALVEQQILDKIGTEQTNTREN